MNTQGIQTQIFELVLFIATILEIETDIQNYCHTLKALKCNENSTCNLK